MEPLTVGRSTAAALRVAAVAVLGLVGPGLALASAQTPAPPATLTFDLDGGLVFWTIKPDKVADFEFLMGKLKEALLKSEDPARKQLATGWKVYKVQEPAPQGNVFFLFLVDPAVKGADYSSAAILKILYDTYPTEAQDLYKKLTDATVGGRNVLNLQTVVTMAP
ncbi:MAG: hypothetical protein AB7I50_06625 [Vicinamibacterales bacterium]